MNKGKLLLERSYHIPLSMFDEAFRCFQRKYVFPLNILISMIFAAIAGVYVHAIIISENESENSLAFLLTAVCIALIFVRWYRPLKQRRAVHEALKELEQDIYTVTVYENAMYVLIEDAPEAEQAAEEALPPAEPETPEDSEHDTENGFRQLFPEAPAEDVQKQEPTEIIFGEDVKIHEYADFFLIYLIKRNFYVIPKKGFSEAELKQLRTVFQIKEKK